MTRPALALLVLATLPVADAPAQGQHALRGRISWYGPGFEGKRTASGEPFYADSFTMAHRTLPFGTRVKVTNLRNGRSVVVRVTDRGPWDSTRVADLSAAAAKEIGMWRRGLARAKLTIIAPTTPHAPPTTSAATRRSRTSPAPPP